jgi:hypothetical protein
MENNYGKLILLSDGGPEQEYELGKARVTLGRANTNDIILSDDRMSRSHALLECTLAGCTLVTRLFERQLLNGQRAQRGCCSSATRSLWRLLPLRA